MRVTANAYVCHDFGDADRCFEVGARNLKFLQRSAFDILGLLGHRGRLLRADQIRRPQSGKQNSNGKSLYHKAPPFVLSTPSDDARKDYPAAECPSRP